MSTEGAKRPEPAGEGPSWTPKEPRRPFHPKPGAFGPSKTFPLPNAEGVTPPEEPDGPKAP